jgi:hypothetical protein
MLAVVNNRSRSRSVRGVTALHIHVIIKQRRKGNHETGFNKKEWTSCSSWTLHPDSWTLKFLQRYLLLCILLGFVFVCMAWPPSRQLPERRDCISFSCLMGSHRDFHAAGAQELVPHTTLGTLNVTDPIDNLLPRISPELELGCPATRCTEKIVSRTLSHAFC